MEVGSMSIFDNIREDREAGGTAPFIRNCDCSFDCAHDELNRINAHRRSAARVSRLEQLALELEAARKQLKAADELADAIMDGLCNSSIPGFDPYRLDRALTAYREARG
jgi:hypothetical protein